MKDEFALIDQLTRWRQSAVWLREHGVGVGIGDDAAVVGQSPGYSLVMSCDTMVEGIHFTDWSMTDEDIGYKALATNISDLAAMGAIPRYALVALSVPEGMDEARLQRIYAGLYECADAYEVAVIGGDTTASRQGIVITVTITGEIEAGRALLRSAAKTGDAVFVTGALGASAAGLALLRLAAEGADVAARLGDKGADAAAQLGDGNADVAAQLGDGNADVAAQLGDEEAMRALTRAHRRPAPQVAAGRLLVSTGHGRALNDISDGLASEAAEIAAASGVGLAIEEAQLPLPQGMATAAEAAGASPLDWVLYGGEDYQLLGTAAQERIPELQAAFHRSGLQLHVIGYATDAFKGVRLRRADGTWEPLEKRGYNHFCRKD